MGFRADVNGLRAIAILAVILFHMDFAYCGGGYVGVDLFFVISGFLVTSILTSEINTNSFNYLSFIKKRINRIVPSLALVVIAVMIFGYKFIVPTEYRDLSYSSMSALLFFSNVRFWSRVGYFDVVSNINWWIHSWALSVEWQFYLIFPLILKMLNKIKVGKYYKQGLFGIFIFSFLLSLIITYYRPQFAFFSLPTRLFEFIAGGLLCFYGYKIKNLKYAFEIGIFLIFVAIFTYSSAMAFPGLYVLLPVLGSCMVIASDKKKSFLDNKIVQYIGYISYSLYLWHWVIITAFKYFEVFDIWYMKVLVLLLSFIIAQLNFSLLEEPIRKYSNKNKHTAYIIIAVVLFLSGYLLFIKKNDGLYFRVPEKVIEANNLYRDNFLRYEFKETQDISYYKFGDISAIPSVAVWGDSHVGANISSLADLIKERDKSLIFYTNSACPSVLDVMFLNKSDNNKCKNLNNNIYNYLIDNKNIQDVFLISRWPVYLYGMNEKNDNNEIIIFNEGVTEADYEIRKKDYIDNIIKTACKLNQHGKEVHILSSVPELIKNVNIELAKNYLLDKKEKDIFITYKEYMKRNEFFFDIEKKLSKNCKINFIDSSEYFCDEKGICRGNIGSKPLYTDDDHLNVFGSAMLKPAFAQALGYK